MLFDSTDNLNVVEWQMYCLLTKIQKHLKKYTNKLNVTIENISNVMDICPILKQKMEDTVKMTIELDEFNVLCHELGLIGILLRCLAGNFTSKCMDKFLNRADEIFVNVSNMLLVF